MKVALLAVVAVAIFGLGGCSTFAPKITLSSPEQVIIQQQSIAGGAESNQPMADAECKKYNPQSVAVFKTTITDVIADKSVYDCVVR